jgi:dUTP pyrophosphatase
MDKVVLKIKKRDPKAKIPKYETAGSAGMDVSACLKKMIGVWPGCTEIIDTGLEVEIPEGFELQVRPRSGLAAKHNVTVLNSPGTVDSDYRGPLKIILTNLNEKKVFNIQPGDRIAQIVMAPVVQATVVEVQETSETDRGEGGLGSTGMK